MGLFTIRPTRPRGRFGSYYGQLGLPLLERAPGIDLNRRYLGFAVSRNHGDRQRSSQTSSCSSMTTVTKNSTASDAPSSGQPSNRISNLPRARLHRAGAAPLAGVAVPRVLKW